MNWRVALSLTLALLASAPVATACPGFLFIDSFGPAVLPGKRKELNLFTLRTGATGERWEKQTLQIDPFSVDGKIKFFDPGAEWLEEPLQPFDRLAMDSGHFANRYHREAGFPCTTDHVFEIRTQDMRYAYLAFCKEKKNWNHQIAFHTIKHDAPNREVRTPNFQYRYAADNHLLFQSIALPYDRPGNYPLLIAENSDQVIRGDVKNFFTLNFTKDDIDAHIARERRGPLGLVGSVNFWLRILFFKIDLRLSPEVSFFQDAVFMPMVMHLPVDATQYLNPGSGLFYTWRAGRDVIIDHKHSRIPDLDAGKVKSGVDSLKSMGLPFCETKTCRFKIVGEIADRLFSLDFNLRRELVERGFFPLLMRDTTKAEKDLGWAASKDRSPGRMGMYFETSGLQQGNHDWEFLIRFAEDYDTLARQCPAEIFTVASYRRPL